MDMKVGEHPPMGVSENGVYPKNGHFKKKMMIIGVLSTILSDKPMFEWLWGTSWFRYKCIVKFTKQLAGSCRGLTNPNWWVNNNTIISWSFCWLQHECHGWVAQTPVRISDFSWLKRQIYPCVLLKPWNISHKSPYFKQVKEPHSWFKHIQTILNPQVVP